MTTRLELATVTPNVRRTTLSPGENQKRGYDFSTRTMCLFGGQTKRYRSESREPDRRPLSALATAIKKSPISCKGRDYFSYLRVGGSVGRHDGCRIPMNSTLHTTRSTTIVLFRIGFFVAGTLGGFWSAFGQGGGLSTVPDPPALAPPPPGRTLPFVGGPDHEGERRRRPLEVAAILDGNPHTPSIQLRHRSLPVLRLPGDPRIGESLTWTGFWLEFRFHPSKAGTSVTAKWLEGATCFFNGALPASDLSGIIGARGIWRIPINFDPVELAAQLAINCEGVETRLYLRRWPSRKH